MTGPARDLEFGDIDLHLFRSGSHTRLYEKLGAHPLGDDVGVSFAVWAPNAAAVSVIGDFNDWTPGAAPLAAVTDAGLWRAVLPGVGPGARYKFRVESRLGGHAVDKADPFGFAHELPPATASVVSRSDYAWRDGDWMHRRAARDPRTAPMSVYEVHLGSWRRGAQGETLGYRELAPLLVEHARRVGFTHVELMPVTEHPFYGSWGYQTTGYFAATSRYGSPDDLRFLVDELHLAGVGVILDWVPGHFPNDEHGLAFFDGTHLFEHADPRQGFHPEWNTSIFNYGRHEVRSFLLSSAHFWLETFHVDGLRVDGVASMLYLDYGRAGGAWIPNEHGGRENLDAVTFLRELNQTIATRGTGVFTVAEDSTAWPMVTGPVDAGGLGFTMKWDLGWMHDTLEYLGRDPIVRKYHHTQLTFRGMYAWAESFVLPLSHDEVVHGKRALREKMWGDDTQKLANLRLLFAYQFAQPGKKLLFMGSELAARTEWSHDVCLEWEVEERDRMELLLGELNRLYRTEPSLHELDFEPSGFAWVDPHDLERNTLSFERRARDARDAMLIVCNFAPVARDNHRVGAPFGGLWREALNTDADAFGGGGHGSLGAVEAAPVRAHDREWSLNLHLPPLAAVFLKPDPLQLRTARG